MAKGRRWLFSIFRFCLVGVGIYFIGCGFHMEGYGVYHLYGGLLSIIVTVISVWISDGFFYALIAGVVSFFVWGLVVGVADKLGMLPD